MKKNSKVALVILDGWGNGYGGNEDATSHANTPFFKKLKKENPSCNLKTSGVDVGLPAGQMGNSEVGHLNIGAGRIVYQDLLRIDNALADKSFDKNPTIQQAFRFASDNNRDIHLMGLLSDGGVHSSMEHLFRFTQIAAEQGLHNVFVHAFMDGRDTDPRNGLKYLDALQNHLNKTTGKIASVMGRYYAMDRDKRWDRTKLAYDALVHGKGRLCTDVTEYVKRSYEEGITDEFIKPIIAIGDSFFPFGIIKDGDVVICFNFRTDRCRQITEVLTQHNMPEHEMRTINLHYATMTSYDDSYKNVNVIFQKDNLKFTLGEVLANAAKTQVRIAETEKYPHVTFFFSGGREKPFTGESRLMIPSPKVATYDLQPEMSAEGVKDAFIKEIEENKPDFVCLNFANPDMVGHTGVFSAVVKALETVDTWLEEVMNEGLKQGYSFLITADHGNAEYMINSDGSPNTAHTTFTVPCVYVGNDADIKLSDGRLADLAPTILQLLDLNAPEEMTGNSLIK